MLDSLMSLVTPQIAGSLASRLGESEGAVKNGLTASSASLLSALANRSGDTGFLSQILGLLNGPGASGLLGSLAGMASGGGASELGSKLLSMALGSQQSAATDLIARAAGVKGSSASGLLSMAAPLVLGFLGKRVSEGSLSAGSLGKLLSAEVPSLQSSLPSGFGGILSSLSVSSASAAHASEEKSGGWLWSVLAGLALLAGLYWFFSGGAPPVKDVAQDAASKAAQTATQATSSVTGAAKSAWAALGEFFKRKLPNGIELNIPRLGVENKLVDFIEDGGKMVDKTTWFDFDRLLFDTGSATLQSASQEQLGNIAAILKAFPKVKIKLGGYTDNVGDAAANMKLSADRANNVMAELVKLGVESGRLSAEGYGDQHPAADNTTEEGRQKNRRIAMRVTEK